VNADERFLVALRLSGRPCLVIGESAEAARRAQRLLDAGARVTVVAALPCPELGSLADSGAVHLERRDFDESDLETPWLVVLAELDEALAERVGRACLSRRIFFCAVDQPEHNGFDHVAVARAGRVSFGVSTSGSAPGLAGALARELRRVSDEADLGTFSERLASLREATPPADRKERLAAALDGLRFGQIELPRDRG
jgi:siroheme synthase-like protein